MPTYLPSSSSQSRAGLSGGVSTVNSNTTQLSWWKEQELSLYNKWNNLGKYFDSVSNNSYFDYFYSGQDVEVYIDGLRDPDDVLPIYAFAYKVQQNKQPLYGFWDYTYSAMMRGNRIISGAFSIVPMYPYMLTEAIAKAAQVRAQAANKNVKSLSAVRGLDDDEANIDRYWRRHYDSNLDLNQQHLFSIHPPFNFLLEYGIQETSMIVENPSVRAQEIRDHFQNQTAMMSDINERLVRNAIDDSKTKVLIENVELMSKDIEFDAEGNPILETYTFLARDERFLHNVNYNSLNTSQATSDSSSYGGGGGGKVNP